MWLINATTLQLEEFFDESIPPYAILSHTWEKGEITFQEWASRDTSPVSEKPGLAKIKGACRQALKDSIGYVWVDTNCIDKTSSSELSEAINSMFAWYKGSVRCYVYLLDVSAPDTPVVDPDISLFEQSEAVRTDFSSSKWFTRGWTLQELLASPHVTFFTNCWQRLGDKNDPALSQAIAAITGISVEIITNPENIEHASIAERFSWMANRVTTRSEDIAYCLLGIFDINMPLLYGEGRKAFLRLQEQIIAVSNDQTIFCWSYYLEKKFPPGWNNVFAPHPSAFRDSAKFNRKTDERAKLPEVYSITNAGLSITLKASETSSPFYIGVLAVECKGWGVGIVLDAAGSRHPSFQGPISFPSSIIEDMSLRSQPLFLKCRGNGTSKSPSDQVPLLLVAPSRIYMVASSSDDVLYDQSHEHTQHFGGPTAGILLIPSVAFKTVGSAVCVVFSAVKGYRHFLVGAVRTLEGHEWYCQSISSSNVQHSLDAAMNRLQYRYPGIKKSIRRGLGEECAMIVPQPPHMNAPGAMVFVTKFDERFRVDTYDTPSGVGAYYNIGLIDEVQAKEKIKRIEHLREDEKVGDFKCCAIL